LENLLANADSIEFLNVVLNSIVVIVLLAFSRTNIQRVRRMLDILDNGGWRHCPLYKESVDSPHRRWYDCTSGNPKNTQKGGEKHAD
jgi:hypothetical protein